VRQACASTQQIKLSNSANALYQMLSLLYHRDGKAPSTLTATKFSTDDPETAHPTVEMTRPLCPYPQEAKYNGSGNKNVAHFFLLCKAMKRNQ
jgi:hypothetical protein